jgi:hypothetical protein
MALHRAHSRFRGLLMRRRGLRRRPSFIGIVFKFVISPSSSAPAVSDSSVFASSSSSDTSVAAPPMELATLDEERRTDQLRFQYQLHRATSLCLSSNAWSNVPSRAIDPDPDLVSFTSVLLPRISDDPRRCRHRQCELRATPITQVPRSTSHSC